MNKTEFEIGLKFYCADKQWMCTDIGTRTINAICLSNHKNDPTWFNGPPYACAEIVFDENDQEGCLLHEIDP